MCRCVVCERIRLIKEQKNPYFVKELKTGYVVIGDIQRIKGYTLFLCKECQSELHFLEPSLRDAFLHEMAIVAQAVYQAFSPEKLNYELLGVGAGAHMHWHIFPRRAGDTPKSGPVWQLGEELHDDRYRPDETELKERKEALKRELDQLC